MMKTLLAACALLGAVVAFSGTAAADPTDHVRIPDAFETYGGSDNPCNGVADDNCVCDFNSLTCQYGQHCRSYVFGQCVYG